jgi:hypothetical protein
MKYLFAFRDTFREKFAFRDWLRPEIIKAEMFRIFSDNPSKKNKKRYTV